MKTRTRQTDPKMIREARLTTRSGSWYSPIPQHAASRDLITYPCMLVQTSSHLYVHVHVCIQARAAAAWDIFHFRQRGQTTRRDVGVRIYPVHAHTLLYIASFSPTCDLDVVRIQLQGVPLLQSFENTKTLTKKVLSPCRQHVYSASEFNGFERFDVLNRQQTAHFYGFMGRSKAL